MEDRKVRKQYIKVTYLSHSGFVVETEDAVLVFDYYKGELPQTDQEKPCFVFASHGHYDHFRKDIFDWEQKFSGITYILSADIKESRENLFRGNQKENCIFVKEDEDILVDGCRVRTLLSTDLGVAFLVERNGVTIYHAGDLNWWHWEGEPDAYNEEMKTAYFKELDKIKGAKIDIAFVPVDGRLEAQYYYGVKAFMDATHTDRVFPMHGWGDYALGDRLLNQDEMQKYRQNIMKITQENQTFELEIEK